MCPSGLGGSLEGHPFPCPARVAQRQRLPLARTSATYAFFSSLLWEHFQNPHWDWKHLDSPARSVVKLLEKIVANLGLTVAFLFSPLRADLIPLFGHTDHAAAQHVFHGPVARESGIRDVLPGGCSLPQFLLALSYRLLPFWEGVSNFLQVSSVVFHTLFAPVIKVLDILLCSFRKLKCVCATTVNLIEMLSTIISLSELCIFEWNWVILHFRLDYSGIALLIMGSFVPWLYYSFYCSPQPRLIYLSIVCVLGIAAIVVAQWDRFSTPRHRPTRAGVNRQHTNRRYLFLD